MLKGFLIEILGWINDMTIWRFPNGKYLLAFIYPLPAHWDRANTEGTVIFGGQAAMGQDVSDAHLGSGLVNNALVQKG